MFYLGHCSAVGFLLLLSSVTYGLDEKKEHGSKYWYDLGLADLKEALRKPVIEGRAKNVVLLLGDGFGISTMTAGRIFKGQKMGQSGEEGFLSFEKMPNLALLKTYNVDKQVPDSAATATAFLSGVKANFYTLGHTAAVKKGDCAASRKPENRAHSILSWAQEKGKETGIVTNTRVTHATPAASYAGSPQREWECDAKIKILEDPEALLCKDIAMQLVEDLPGRDFKVILAGGRQPLGAQSPNSTSTTCKRLDGRNLVQDWKNMKHKQGVSHEYVTNTQQLEGINLANTEYIMGLFAESHLEYEINRNQGPHGQPSLKQMTTAAIKRLQRSEEGYVLLVEGGRIDHGLHNGKPQLALEEVVAFDQTVEAVLQMVDLQDTLVIVTADHSHGLTINGYPERGNDILGTASYDEGVTDGMPFTTLMFTTGPGYSYHWDGEKVSRRNVTGVDTHSQDYQFQSAVPTKPGWSTHGGEDVAIFAAGPWAHLFHRVHEQSYVAHVIGYSAGIGPFADDTNRPMPDSSSTRGHPRSAQSKDGGGATISSSPHVLICLMIAVFAVMSSAGGLY